MIIRIMGEGQFNIQSSFFDELNEIDNKIVEHVSNGDDVAYRDDLASLISIIRKNGKPVADEDIVESDIVVPPEDLSFEEAKDVFTGEGIFED